MSTISPFVVPKLNDKQLKSEFNTIAAIFDKVITRIQRGEHPSDIEIPTDYVTKGKGHQTFFFDKCFYLYTRYHAIFNEMHYRDDALNEEKFQEYIFKYKNHIHMSSWDGSWK